MRHKAMLSRFLIERIPADWIDRLYPQGWEEEDLYPTPIVNDIISHGSSSTAH